MLLRLFIVSIIFFGFTPIKSDVVGSAAFYIIDSDYLSYRHKLNSDAMKDPLRLKRLEDGSLSIEEFKKLIKAEVEPKLKIYREEHGLDVNGAKK